MKLQQWIFYNWASGGIRGANRRGETNALSGRRLNWERTLIRLYDQARIAARFWDLRLWRTLEWAISYSHGI
jgi:hypothetical protein